MLTFPLQRTNFLSMLKYNNVKRNWGLSRFLSSPSSLTYRFQY